MSLYNSTLFRAQLDRELFRFKVMVVNRKLASLGEEAISPEDESELRSSRSLREALHRIQGMRKSKSSNSFYRLVLRKIGLG